MCNFFVAYFTSKNTFFNSANEYYKKYVWTIWETYVESTPFRATENLNALGWTLGDLEGLSWSSLRYKCIFSSSRYVAVTQVAHKIICLRFISHC